MGTGERAIEFGDVVGSGGRGVDGVVDPLAGLRVADQDADRFSDNVIKSVRRREQTRRWMRTVRIGVSVAACLAIGFSVG